MNLNLLFIQTLMSAMRELMVVVNFVTIFLDPTLVAVVQATLSLVITTTALVRMYFQQWISRHTDGQRFK